MVPSSLSGDFNPFDKVREGCSFKPEGYEAEVPGKGHLKNLSLCKEGNRIDPFRQRPEIPELPQKAADKTRYRPRQ